MPTENTAILDLSQSAGTLPISSLILFLCIIIGDARGIFASGHVFYIILVSRNSSCDAMTGYRRLNSCNTLQCVFLYPSY